MSTDHQVSASILADLHSFASGYDITRYADDPEVDVGLSIALGAEGRVELELTDDQAEQLADDLRTAVRDDQH
jgi:chemotaxis protein CheY-P-specific phosphatase CheC